MVTFHFSLVDFMGYLVIPVFLPLLVGLVTTKVTSSGAKAWLLAGLAALTSLSTQALAAWQSGTAYDLWLGLMGVVPVFVIAVATHYGLWKATGTTSVVQSVGYNAKHKAE